MYQKEPITEQHENADEIVSQFFYYDNPPWHGLYWHCACLIQILGLTNMHGQTTKDRKQSNINKLMLCIWQVAMYLLQWCERVQELAHAAYFYSSVMHIHWEGGGVGDSPLQKQQEATECAFPQDILRESFAQKVCCPVFYSKWIIVPPAKLWNPCARLSLDIDKKSWAIFCPFGIDEKQIYSILYDTIYYSILHDMGAAYAQFNGEY